MVPFFSPAKLTAHWQLVGVGVGQTTTNSRALLCRRGCGHVKTIASRRALGPQGHDQNNYHHQYHQLKFNQHHHSTSDVRFSPSQTCGKEAGDPRSSGLVLLFRPSMSRANIPRWTVTSSWRFRRRRARGRVCWSCCSLPVQKIRLRFSSVRVSSVCTFFLVTAEDDRNLTWWFGAVL